MVHRYTLSLMVLIRTPIILLILSLVEIMANKYHIPYIYRKEMLL